MSKFGRMSPTTKPFVLHDIYRELTGEYSVNYLCKQVVHVCGFLFTLLHCVFTFNTHTHKHTYTHTHTHTR